MNLQTDSLTRALYAQDASMYEQLPEGVVFPSTAKEVQKWVKYAQKNQKTITARSAGTSLAGQTTTGGIVMDVSRHLNDIVDVNVQEQWAVIQPGVIRDSLNTIASKYGLLFGPDTATTNRCMLGGMIGNNSAGAFSIKYQTTRQHVKEMDVVLSDGSLATFKAMNAEELEQKLTLNSLEGHIYRSMTALLKRYKSLIEHSYPHKEIIRRNTGYALDALCEMEPITSNGRPFNLCELLCGSEGTLALTVQAKVHLEKIAPHKTILVPHFSSIEEAMKATIRAVAYQPAAVELVDDIILNATKGNLEQSKNRFFLDGEPKCILIIQLEDTSQENLLKRVDELKSELEASKLSRNTPVITQPSHIDKVWTLRKAGLGLLMGLGKESRTPAFCEDTAVRVQDLPEYVAAFKEILHKYETDCVFYAHASVGELHLRPMIDTTTKEGVEKLKAMAKEVAVLVKSFGGSLSGEHGDGRARAPYIKEVLGEEMLTVLQQVKEIWDPEYRFNPGKIVQPYEIETDLRYSPAYRPTTAPTVFKWRKEGSFSQALELCNGAGVCRKLSASGGTMCPSYMATEHEKDSTRGRANVFRQMFEGKNHTAFASKEVKEALDLCLSCKACKSECPANVDMAKMKAEFLHGWHRKEGESLQRWFFGNTPVLYPFAAAIPSFSNRILSSAIGKWMLQKTVGISSKRTLPAFAPIPFLKQKKQARELSSEKKVVMLVDTFTNVHQPEIADDMRSILEFLGYQVIVSNRTDWGRTYLSQGMLLKAKQTATEIVDEVYVYAKAGIPIVGIEPSELLTLKDEIPDLVDQKWQDQAETIAGQTFLLEEFLHLHEAPVLNGEKKSVIVHNHCHSRALSDNSLLKNVLEEWGYSAKMLDAGCCGMAGSFGYEKKKYSISMQIGEQRLFPAIRNRNKNSNICAPGFSCRHQIADGTGAQAVHPATLIAQTIRSIT